jgi:hypothetical protein
MTLIFLGSKRVYVAFLFWQRVTDPRCALSHPLAQIDRALGGEGPGCCGEGSELGCRIVMAVRLYRMIWERLIGLSLLVFEPSR